MAKKIVWNKRAIVKLDEIVEYLWEEVSEASEASARKFFEKLTERLEWLSYYPEIGRKSRKKKTIRMYKIDKHRDLYYRIQGNNLIVVYIFDTRQHPSQNPY